MDFDFFTPKKETPRSLRRKADALLARSEDLSGPTKGSSTFGENRLKRAGFESDFRQFRPYRTQDRPQDIDWKRSARGDDTLVREREQTQRRLIDLHIQDDPGMQFGTPGKYDTACVLGLAFAVWAARKHDPVRLSGQKLDIETMAGLLCNRTGFAGNDWQKNSIAILIGDCLETDLKSVQARHVLVLQTLSPEELDLPFHGRHVFEDGSVKALINHTDAVRAHYQSALTAHVTSLETYCRDRNWHYGLIRTDDDLAPHLTRALSAIGDRR